MPLNFGDPQRFAGLEDLLAQAAQEIRNTPQAHPAAANSELLSRYRLEPTMRLYRGESLTTRGGTFFSENENYARNFATGEHARMLTVEVPHSIAHQSAKAAQSGANVGMQLPIEWANAAYEHTRAPEIRVEKAAQSFSFSKRIARKLKMAVNQEHALSQLGKM